MVFTYLLIFSLVNLILWIVAFSKLKKTYSPDKVLANIRVEVDKLLIEISRETDRDLTLIEEKIIALKKIIEQADKRLGVLVNEQDKKSTVETVEEQITNIQNQVKSNTYADEAKKALKHNSVKKQNGTISLFPAEDIVQTPVPIKDQVVELYKSNIAEALIADRLNITMAEVQMIVNLYCK